MRSSRYATLLIALALGVACSPAPSRPPAGGSSGGATTQANEKSVVIVLPAEPKNLNPIFQSMWNGNFPFSNGLVKLDKNLSYVPDLASQMPEFSQDMKTVTVKLRDGVRFHDGKPLTAADVAFTYQTLADSKTAAELRIQFDSLQEAKAIDASTVQFVLKRTDPAFLDKLYIGIVPKHLLEDQDINTAAFNSKPVGTGPFAFKEWRAGERIVLEANSDYFGGRPPLDRIVYTWSDDENARVTMIANGSADITTLPPKLATRFRSDPKFRVTESKSADFRTVVLPANHPILSDPEVRRALFFAVDREGMVKGVLDGVGEPAFGEIPSGHWAYDDRLPVTYDPEKAKSMLAARGWRDTNGDGFLDKDGTKFSFLLMYPASDSLRKELALAVRSDLAKIGVDVNLEGLSFDAIYPKIASGEGGNVFGWGNPYDPDLQMVQLFHSRGVDDGSTSTNPAYINSPAIDAALDTERNALDRAVRKDAFLKLQQAIRENGQWLYLVRLTHVAVVPSRLQNFDPQVTPHGGNLNRGFIWNMEQWNLQ